MINYVDALMQAQRHLKRVSELCMDRRYKEGLHGISDCIVQLRVVIKDLYLLQAEQEKQEKDNG